MTWLDEKYVNLISSKIKSFKFVSAKPYLCNFRCVYCGDSKKNQSKRRAYFYYKEGSLRYHCHNCGINKKFEYFLNEKFNLYYMDYKLEAFEDKKGFDVSDEIKEKEYSTFNHKKVQFKDRSEHEKPGKHEDSNGRLVDDNNSQNIDFGYSLGDSRSLVAYEYLKNRMIPEQYYADLYYSDDIRDVIYQFKEYRDKENQFKEIPKMAGIVIPFYVKNKEFSHLCFRNIACGYFRYLNFKIDNRYPKLWGLKYIDWNRDVNILEGSMDAMCYPNSLALSGAGGNPAIQYLENMVDKKEKICFIYDNEIFKNRQIYTQLKKRIAEGFSVVIFDRRFKSKDINDALTSGEYSTESLISYLETRKFTGLKALIEISMLSNRKNRL